MWEDYYDTPTNVHTVCYPVISVEKVKTRSLSLRILLQSAEPSAKWTRG